MTIHANRVDNTIELQKKLEDVGIPVSVNKHRGNWVPGGDNGWFTIDKNARGDKIRLWAGDATFTVKPNKGLRQVVVNVSEGPRTATSRYSHSIILSPKDKNKNPYETLLSIPEDGHAGDVVTDQPAEAEISEALIAAIRNEEGDSLGPVVFGLNHMEGTTYRATNISKSITKTTWANYDVWDCDIEATTPATTTSFLVGYDEHSVFISQLPETVRSVAEAHKLLLPPEIEGREGVQRQGEWYFVPVTVEELGSWEPPSYLDLLDMEEGSNHCSYGHEFRLSQASSVVSIVRAMDSRILAQVERLHGEEALAPERYGSSRDWSRNLVTLFTGMVVDERGTHETLYLTGWNLAIRNNEVLADDDVAWD